MTDFPPYARKFLSMTFLWHKEGGEVTKDADSLEI